MNALLQTAGFRDRRKGLLGTIKGHDEILLKAAGARHESQGEFTANPKIIEKHARQFAKNRPAIRCDAVGRSSWESIHTANNRDGFTVDNPQTAGRSEHERNFTAQAPNREKPVGYTQSGEHAGAIVKAILVDIDFPFADDLPLLRALARLARQNRQQNRSGDGRSGAHDAFPFPRKNLPHHARNLSRSASRPLPADAAGRSRAGLSLAANGTASVSGAFPNGTLAVTPFERQRTARLAPAILLCGIAISLGVTLGTTLGVLIEVLR